MLSLASWFSFCFVRLLTDRSIFAEIRPCSSRPTLKDTLNQVQRWAAGKMGEAVRGAGRPEQMSNRDQEGGQRLRTWLNMKMGPLANQMHHLYATGVTPFPTPPYTTQNALTDFYWHFSMCYNSSITLSRTDWQCGRYRHPFPMFVGFPSRPWASCAPHSFSSRGQAMQTLTMHRNEAPNETEQDPMIPSPNHVLCLLFVCGKTLAKY